MTATTTPTKAGADRAPVPDPLTPRSLPHDLPDVPEAVRVATERYHRAEARRNEIHANMRAAQRELRDAPLTDRVAAADAETAGEQVPALTAPVVRQRVETLTRELAAADAEIKRASDAQDRAVRTHRADWREVAGEAVDVVLAELDAAIERVDDLVDRLDQTAAIALALDRCADPNDGYHGMLNVQWPPLGATRKWRERERAKAHTSRGYRPDDIPAVLAIFQQLAEQARGKAPAPRERDASV